MITISWHLLLLIAIIFVILAKGLSKASEEHGFLEGVGCLPYLLLAFVLFLLYGGIFLW